MTAPSGVSRRIQQCVEHIQERDWEGALVNLFPALDKTAKKRWPTARVGERLRVFLEEEQTMISAVAKGNVFKGLYRHHVLDLWRRSLKRRSQKGHMTWARMVRLADEWLPPPHVLHPWPEERMAVRYPKCKPYALIGHVRICAGGAG